MTMAGHVIIDGNNLLHAMHAHAPMPNIGRETLVRIVERWAATSDDSVTLVFDGAAPEGDMAKQIASRRIHVVFAVPLSADDVIVEKVHRAHLPDRIRVVTDDTAIAHEARMRHCTHLGCAAFIRTLLAPPAEVGCEKGDEGESSPDSEKPESVSPEEIERWVEYFEDEEGPLDDRQYR
jgi:predicted RNA-binding protein with PIN domain